MRFLGLLAAAAVLLAACGSDAASPTPPSASPTAAVSGSTGPSPSPATPRATRSAAGSTDATSPGAPGRSAPGSVPPRTPASGSGEPSGSALPVGPDLTGTSYSYEPPGTKGGALVIGALTFPTTINPYGASSVAELQTFRAASFNGFVTVTNDLRYLPDLVTGVPLLSNGGVVVRGEAMDVTWELKPGMRWSDGQPITCADLDATWKWNVASNAGPAGPPAGWRDVGAVQAVTDTTCVMHFTRIYEGYLELVSTLLPKRYLDAVAAAGAEAALYPLLRPVDGIYSGPYVPIEVVPGARITFVPNPDWATIGGHPASLERIVYRVYPNPAALIAAYRSGEIQLAMDLGETDLEQLGSVPLNEIRRTAALTYVALDFNGTTLRSALGDDWQTVVRAVRLAIDRDALSDAAMGGTVQPTRTFVSPLAWYARASGQPAGGDPDAARQLLVGAGWQPAADGTRARNGTRLALDLCTSQATADVDAAAEVARQLAAIGIAATVVPRPAEPDVYGAWNAVSDTTACNADRGTFTVLLRDHTSTVDPLGGYDRYVSDRTPDSPPHDGQNDGRANLPSLDEAYRTLRDSVDLSTIQNAMDVVQDIFASDQNTFEVPLFTRTDVWLAATTLRNFTPNASPASGSWNIGDWWISR